MLSIIFIWANDRAQVRRVFATSPAALGWSRFREFVGVSIKKTTDHYLVGCAISPCFRFEKLNAFTA